jgi:hypothetical protein
MDMRVLHLAHLLGAATSLTLTAPRRVPDGYSRMRTAPRSTTRVDDAGQGLPASRRSKFVARGRSNGLKIIDPCGRPTGHSPPSRKAGERSQGEGDQGGALMTVPANQEGVCKARIAAG